MTLEEKFENILHNWIDKDYNRQHVADELGTEAEDFAIGFVEWVECSKTYYTPMKELLELYKKHYDTKRKSKRVSRKNDVIFL